MVSRKEVIEAANDTVYGLAANVFTENVGRAVRVAHALEAGSTWVCILRLFFSSDWVM